MSARRPWWSASTAIKAISIFSWIGRLVISNNPPHDRKTINRKILINSGESQLSPWVWRNVQTRYGQTEPFPWSFTRNQLSLKKGRWDSKHPIKVIIKVLSHQSSSPCTCVSIILSNGYGYIDCFSKRLETLSSVDDCFVPQWSFFVVFLLICPNYNLFSSLWSPAKEPTQKKTYSGDKFAASHHCEQNLSQPIMVVFKANWPLVTAP